ncbi:MAG: DUF1540 domain-containing protein [Oscillospiraceae bacterium]|nr:DUF1540 domain-containing protein [Oscillospiraceae bacterium]
MQPIREISCSANRCVYNCQGSKCGAKHITVDQPGANCAADTLCATFQLK